MEVGMKCIILLLGFNNGILINFGYTTTDDIVYPVTFSHYYFITFHRIWTSTNDQYTKVGFISGLFTINNMTNTGFSINSNNYYPSNAYWIALGDLII